MKSRKNSAKTKELIKKTFLNLYDKNTVDKISIRKLCEIIGINRSTFYLYYTDIYNLLEQIEKEKAEILASSMSKALPLVMDGKDFSAFLPDEDFVKKNEEWLKSLVIPYGKSNIIRRVVNLLKASACEYIDVDVSRIDPELNYALEYMLTADVGMFEAWLRNNKDIEIDKLKKLIELSTCNGPIDTINHFRKKSSSF